MPEPSAVDSLDDQHAAAVEGQAPFLVWASLELDTVVSDLTEAAWDAVKGLPLAGLAFRCQTITLVGGGQQPSAELCVVAVLFAPGATAIEEHERFAPLALFAKVSAAASAYFAAAKPGERFDPSGAGDVRALDDRDTAGLELAVREELADGDAELVGLELRREPWLGELT